MIKYIVTCIDKAKDGVFIFTPENNPRMALKMAGNGFKIGEKYKVTILASGAMEIEICPNSGDLKETEVDEILAIKKELAEENKRTDKKGE